ncbi:PREDICTED: periodic tryptophan protein 2 homolog [Branchiostoma belcheri]|uniref:Periodic tryptophan protein 2 homolog n=1 Tax=Branchiostoma belcheri TaxID=7741 RepID=A0A6P4Y877_BRABE|nr:PREDICTED: periodic tryptophan protein 2 homolog [Branchiostoma belcheri]
MKFSYKFSNLLGSVYRRGNVSFTPDGNSIISPVGHRVSVFDLKNNKSETLPVEAQMNIVCVAQSPDGSTAILVDEAGAALLVSLVSKSVLHHYHFHKPVHTVKFSPDGRKFAVTRENHTLVYHAPGKTHDFNPFRLYRSYHGPYDDATCIDWTDDSRAFAVGSKDMNTRVHAATALQNLAVYSFGGHKDAIVGCFFEHKSLDLYTISRDGTLVIWECDTDLDGLVPGSARPKKEKEVEEKVKGDSEESEEEEDKDKQEKILYKKVSKHYFNKEGDFNTLTSCDYHKRTHFLVTGFASGIFHLHELPDFNLIHSLSISDQRIASVSFNSAGDWIALACSGLGQLLVWEWQSESYVLKQQGHFNNMSSLAYSPDGQYIVTGGEDGKVKVWNTGSGFCFVTFTEHTAAIVGTIFTSNRHVVISASLDGTARAFDLHRYRNFRTFTSPRPAQFSCLAVDHSGDLVCCGAQDMFEIFVWSMQTGRLLEVLAGHEGPVASLSFSPADAILASASWDKTVRVWDIFEHKGCRETLQLGSDALAVTFRPDGKEVAIAMLSGEIQFWDPHNANQTGSIEGRHDLGAGRKETDKITAKTSAAGKAFSTLCYTADGTCILAGGRSKNICIYHVAEQLLIKKFEISCNLSFDAMEEYLDRRKMTEWGSLALVDEGQEEGEGGTAISLPGVRKGDMASRHWKPEVRVSCVQFSPTGRAFATTTTEGLMVYSLDNSLTFDPFDLDMDITPATIRRMLGRKEYATALMMSFRLNEGALIQEVVETIPHTEVSHVSQTLPDTYVDRMLLFVASQLETSRHLEFYLTWCQTLLMLHGQRLKNRSMSVLAMLRALQKSVTRRYEDISKLCDSNRYSLQYILSVAQQEGSRKRKAEGDQEEEEEEMEELGDEDSSIQMSEDDLPMQSHHV